MWYLLLTGECMGPRKIKVQAIPKAKLLTGDRHTAETQCDDLSSL